MQKSGVAWELIVIGNDLSNFERKIIFEFKEKKDFVKFFEVEREPLYTSWNRGVKLAIYDILGFWNVDDERFSGSVLDGIKKILDDKFNLVYFPFIYKRYLKLFGCNILVKKIIIKPSSFNKEIFKKEMHIGPFFIFTKNFFNKVGCFDESFKIAGDFDWQVRAADYNEFFLSDNVAGIFRNDGSGLSGRKDVQQKKENEIIYKKNENNSLHTTGNKIKYTFNVSIIFFD